jgi:hypothetical protein
MLLGINRDDFMYEKCHSDYNGRSQMYIRNLSFTKIILKKVISTIIKLKIDVDEDVSKFCI